MTNYNFTIRNMTRSEFDTAIEWAAREGWNPGIHDADCFFHTDPTGYFMGFLDDEPISCISAVSYSETFGFLGFYITKPEHRGQGYGIQVWKKAIEYLKTQNIGLDGVVAQQENYKKYGFKRAYSNIRYQSSAKHTNLQNKNQLKLIDVSFSSLLSYDNHCFPTPRPQFLKCWISRPESFSVASVINNQITGYGVVRKCRKGYKVGPLFADDFTIARQLYQSLCNCVSVGTPIYLDVPEINKEALKLADEFGMKRIFRTVRMYTKEQPKINLNKVFGVTTFELG